MYNKLNPLTTSDKVLNHFSLCSSLKTQRRSIPRAEEVWELAFKTVVTIPRKVKKDYAIGF